MVKDLKQELVNTKNDISNLTQEIAEINKIVTNQNKDMLDFTEKIDSNNKNFIKEVLTKQQECIEISNKVITGNVNLVNTTVNLTTQTKDINVVINKIENKLTETSNIVSNVHRQINGGKEIYTIEGVVEMEVPSLITTVGKLTESVKGNIESIRAILTFLGVELGEIGSSMIERIRESTGREDVYQVVLERENLDNVEPVDNNEVDNIYQNERDER